MCHVCSLPEWLSSCILRLNFFHCTSQTCQERSSTDRDYGVSWVGATPDDYSVEFELDKPSLSLSFWFEGTSNIGYNVLNNGVVCPIVGILTSDEDILVESIKQGVRLIDTTLCNQAQVGRAISQGWICNAIIEFHILVFSYQRWCGQTRWSFYCDKSRRYSSW